jgi:hypothetical protein
MYGIPSARQKRFHPKDEHKKDGFIKHCKRVAYWCVSLCREHNFLVIIRDCMIAAALTHDLGRVHKIRGKPFPFEQFNVHGHSNKSWVMIEQSLTFGNYQGIAGWEGKRCTNFVRRFVLTHMSHWDDRCPQPETLPEHIFATADYVASRSWMKTPTLDRLKEHEIENLLEVEEIK